MQSLCLWGRKEDKQGWSKPYNRGGCGPGRPGGGDGKGKVLTVRNEVPPSIAGGPTQYCLLMRQFPLDGSISHSARRWLHLSQMTLAISFPRLPSLFPPSPTFFLLPVLSNSTQGSHTWSIIYGIKLI